MEPEKQPNRWVTLLKRVIGVIVLIALLGVGLYYTAEFSTYAPGAIPAPSTDWGITQDSPIRGRK